MVYRRKNLCEIRYSPSSDEAPFGPSTLKGPVQIAFDTAKNIQQHTAKNPFCSCFEADARKIRIRKRKLQQHLSALIYISILECSYIRIYKYTLILLYSYTDGISI